GRIDAPTTALYQQPDGRNNRVRITVTGLEAPAGRARVTDRRGRLVGTAGLLPTAPSPGAPAAFAGEVWIPLSGPAEFQIDLEVGKQRVGRRRVRLAPPRRWTLYWLSSSHTDVGYTDRQERCLEVHRANLDAALARLADVPGQVATLPTLLAASGVRYLVSGVNPERAVPLLSPADGASTQLAGAWTSYPQLYWWAGPDGSRVLHWRSYGYGDALRF